MLSLSLAGGVALEVVDTPSGVRIVHTTEPMVGRMLESAAELIRSCSVATRMSSAGTARRMAAGADAQKAARALIDVLNLALGYSDGSGSNNSATQPSPSDSPAKAPPHGFPNGFGN